MPPFSMGRPDPTEHASYYSRYIQLVPESDVVQAMTQQIETTLAYLRSLPPSTAGKRYAPDKWNIAEVVGHMCDTERVFAQRALFFARKAPGALPGMEQDDWMKEATFGSQRLDDLINEFEHIRRSDIYFFRQLSDEAWKRRGIASGNEFTVRSLAFIIVGHERHHLEILKTRYT